MFKPVCCLANDLSLGCVNFLVIPVALAVNPAWNINVSSDLAFSFFLLCLPNISSSNLNDALPEVDGLEGVEGDDGLLGILGLLGIEGTLRELKELLEGLLGLEGLEGIDGIEGIEGILGLEGTEEADGLDLLPNIEEAIAIVEGPETKEPGAK